MQRLGRSVQFIAFSFPCYIVTDMATVILLSWIGMSFRWYVAPLSSLSRKETAADFLYMFLSFPAISVL